jgi:hypothetical protein
LDRFGLPCPARTNVTGFGHFGEDPPRTSIGIHELDNEVCLEFFDVGKRSIIFILEDDLKKQQELAARKELTDAVAKFSSVAQTSSKQEIPGDGGTPS